ncbi:MAG: YggS family pyridoxal phosphate-dependent enzyme [Eubacteriales bacterium]|jgi:pyridoxal phosphate enzyme (YggS family)|nr:YggS family pyridoxal phosphate-dependent enzyme [Eubacteriales bacterium]
MSIRDNIELVNENIAKAAERSGRSASDITLVAVTKTVDIARINEAISCGVKALGENKPQEMAEKFPFVQNASWHMIGHLQRNKVRHIIDKADLIHSVDSEKLAAEIDKRAKAINKVQDILIQINISGEATKFGISPTYLETMIENIQSLQNIRVCGLMTIAPLGATETQARNLFENCNKLLIDIRSKKYHNICMEILSMGMSNDYRLAIECGSNLVRIGTGIFGKRNY